RPRSTRRRASCRTPSERRRTAPRRARAYGAGMVHRTPGTPSVVAITGGYVVPVSSPPVEGGTVLIEDGRITAVGQDVTVPDGAHVIDATGRWVLPGFVEAHGHVGIWEE